MLIPCVSCPPDPPSYPRNLRVAETNKGRITIEWDKPETNGGSDIFGYNIEIKHKDDAKYREAGAVDKNSFSFAARNLHDGEPYNFRVRAENRAGFGDFCPEFAKPVLAKSLHGRQWNSCISKTLSDILFSYLNKYLFLDVPQFITTKMQ